MNDEICDQSTKINPIPQQVWERFQYQPSFQMYTRISEPLRYLVLSSTQSSEVNPTDVAQSLVRGLELSATMPEGTRYRNSTEAFEQRFQEWVSQGDYQADAVRQGWILGYLARGLSLDAVDIASNNPEKSLQYLPLFSQARIAFAKPLSWIGFAENLDLIMDNKGYTWNSEHNYYSQRATNSSFVPSFERYALSQKHTFQEFETQCTKLVNDLIQAQCSYVNDGDNQLLNFYKNWFELPNLNDLHDSEFNLHLTAKQIEILYSFNDLIKHSIHLAVADEDTDKYKNDMKRFVIPHSIKVQHIFMANVYIKNDWFSEQKTKGVLLLSPIGGVYDVNRNIEIPMNERGHFFL